MITEWDEEFCNCDGSTDCPFLCEYCEPFQEKKMKKSMDDALRCYVPPKPDIRDLTPNERLKWGYF